MYYQLYTRLNHQLTRLYLRLDNGVDTLALLLDVDKLLSQYTNVASILWAYEYVVTKSGGTVVLLIVVGSAAVTVTWRVSGSQLISGWMRA